MNNEDFIDLVGSLAMADMKQNGICASMTIAQAILESAYGTSELARNANALFGIKANAWTGATYTKKTAEYIDGKYVTVKAKFRAYNSWAESIADHSLYLRTREKAPGVLRYENLIGENDYIKSCFNIQEDGYATSPTYAKKLIALIERYALYNYDLEKEGDSMKIAIDAGHGLKTAGKKCLKSIDPKQTPEWSLNDRIADKLEKILKEYDCDVIRTDDTTGKTDVSLEDRVTRANRYGADIFLSIHHNAGLNGKKGGGTTVYYCGPGGKARAQSVYNNVVQETGLVGNRSSKIIDYGFYVIKYTNMPAYLLENGFMDSPTDTPIILTEDHADKTAKGLLNFLIDFGLKKKDPGFLVKIMVPELNYRAGAGVDYKINGTVKKGEVYTIVATSGSWGKLKSGAGWINISSDYVQRV